MNKNTKLTDKEKEYLIKLFKKAAVELSPTLTQNLLPGNNKTNRDLLNKYDILSGEIEAGNTNREIKKNLKEIVNEMENRGLLTEDEADIVLSRYVS